MKNYKQTIEFLKAIIPVVQKHDGKVFGKRFETDLKGVLPKAYISSYAGLQYVYNGDDRCHIGWDKRPIEASRLVLEITKQIEHYIESDKKQQNDLENIEHLRGKFYLLKAQIEELDDLHYEIKNQLKKEFDLDFKTYYRGE